MDVLSGILISIDHFCLQLTHVVHRLEPQLYGSVLAATLLWFFAFVRRDGSDQS